MRILLVTDLYPLENSYEPKTIQYFAQEWMNQGHIVDIIRPNFLPNTLLRKKKIVKTGTYEENGIKIFNVNYLTPFLFDVQNKLPEYFMVGTYDIVISHMPSGTIFASKLIGDSKKPFVCSVHSSDIEVLTNKLYGLYFAPELKKAYKKANLVSPRSFVLKNKIESLIPETKDKSFVAYSGIAQDKIEEKINFIKKGQEIYNTKTLKIASVANLIKRKNIDVILNSLAKIDFCKWEYTVVGSGNELENLKALAKRLKIEDKVKFCGSLNQEEVYSVLNESNLFILLSKNETFGMAYLEAMAKGNIVIAAQNDGIDGIIKDEENGFTCAIEEEQLTQKIKALINLSYLEIEDISINNYQTINNYTNEKAAENYFGSILNEMPLLCH